MKAAAVEDLFQIAIEETGARHIVDQFRLDEPVFGAPDLLGIRQNGLMRWACSQPGITWEDQVFDWRTLPTGLRQVMLADLFQGVQALVRFAIPVRRLGRVVILAVLPDPDAAAPWRIEVAPATAVKQIPARVEPPARRYLDPPFPMLVFGLASPQLAALQSRCLHRVIQGNVSQIGDTLPAIFEQLAWEEQITVSEMIYYASAMRLLVTGAWRQLEVVAARITGANPTRLQEILNELLIDGQPIEWGDENKNTLRLAP
ncbi:MAG: hypothetical protein EHM12_07300 [Dehalococcoidia bacterium]|nr:MAG: hypothetical protein EHM12_07300 [Dehalococcoidia bacterium]